MDTTLRAASLAVALAVAACTGSSPAPMDDPVTPRVPAATRAPATTAATSDGPARTPRFLATPPPSGEPAPLFDGTIHGWRFAPLDVLREAGLEGGDPLGCEGQEYGATHRTDLDFGVAYLPSGPRSEQVTKSACDDRAYFVTREIFFEETGGYLHMTRVLSGSASLSLEAPASLVESCQIADRPAVCVHYLDDTTGRGGHLAQIIILERPNLDPYGVIFRLVGGEMPFAELVKIASSVSFD